MPRERACASMPKCAALGLTGNCSPTDRRDNRGSRITLDCCMNVGPGGDGDGASESAPTGPPAGPPALVPHPIGDGYCADGNGNGFPNLSLFNNATLGVSIGSDAECASNCASLASLIQTALAGFELRDSKDDEQDQCNCQFAAELACNALLPAIISSGATGCWNPPSLPNRPAPGCSSVGTAVSYMCYVLVDSHRKDAAGVLLRY